MHGERIDAVIAREANHTAALVAASLPTRSRRHGHQPRAASHVELYLAAEVLKIPPAELCRSDPRHRSVVYRSIERGRRLCLRRRAAARPGFSRPYASPRDRACRTA